MLGGDHWRVSFQLYALPEREAELRQELAGLKNSVRFAQRLREAWKSIKVHGISMFFFSPKDLTSRGSQPIEDLTVSLDIVPVDEAALLSRGGT